MDTRNLNNNLIKWDRTYAWKAIFWSVLLTGTTGIFAPGIGLLLLMIAVIFSIISFFMFYNKFSGMLDRSDTKGWTTAEKMDRNQAIRIHMRFLLSNLLIPGMSFVHFDRIRKFKFVKKPVAAMATPPSS